MRSRLIRSSPFTGGIVQWHEHQDGSVTVERSIDEQGFAALAERNKAEFNSFDERSRWGVGRKVADIPMVTYYELMRRGIAQDSAALAKWLDERDNQVFRTAPGKLSR